MSDSFQDGSSCVTAFVVHERECLIHDFRFCPGWVGGLAKSGP
jgi:hypothetical protein